MTQSSRHDLARWRERSGLRAPEETRLIKECIWRWELTPQHERQPAPREALAQELGVSRQYVNRMTKFLLLQAPLDLLEKSPVTPAHVIAFRKRQEQGRQSAGLAAPYTASSAASASADYELTADLPDQPNTQRKPWYYSNGMSIYETPRPLEE